MSSVLFNSKLIKSFDLSSDGEKNIKNDVVYHYTSPEAFLSIIRSGKVRFTDVKYLNDKSETLFFAKKLIEFTEKNNSNYPLFFEIVELLLPHDTWDAIKKLQVAKIPFNDQLIVPYKSDRAFVFCASQDPDSLNMWNYYVKNGFYQGYSLGINIAKFIKTFDTEPNTAVDAFIVYYGNVLYDERKQFEEIEVLANELSKKTNNSSYDLQAAALNLRAYAELQGLFYKSPKFKNEKEHRVIISISNDRIPHNEAEAQKYIGINNQKMTEDYFVRGGLIVPALSVVLPKDAISKVYISPITEFEIAKASTEELLVTYSYKYENKAVDINKSEIPIRF